MQSAHVGGAVKQTTLLNLGSRFDLPQDQWASIALRIDELMRGQASLLDTSLCLAGQALAQLQQRSALGELIGYDYKAMDLNRLYRA